MMHFLRSLAPSRRAVACLVAFFVLAAPLAGRAVLAQTAPNTVRLVVDYGDGASKIIDGLPWAKGNTVFDVMQAAAGRPHGISFSYTGSGDATVLTKIDDVQNQGAGADKKNWQYWVNSTYGDRSFAVFPVQAGDVVTWRFATEQKPTEQKQ